MIISFVNFVFCKLWDICPCIAHVGASALCTEIGVSSVLQGDFLQKHRALLGVRVFYQKISREIIEALCSITSSVFDYKLCVPEGDNSVQGEKWKPCVQWERKFCAVLYAQRSSVF